MHKALWDWECGTNSDTCVFGVCPKGTCINEDENRCESVPNDSTAGSLKSSCLICKKVATN